VLIDLTPERIKEVCGAALLAGGPSRTSPQDMPKRVVVDSREVEKGDLFVGLQGEQLDGGQFAEQAAAAGAWGVLVRSEHGLGVASATGARVRVFGVDDPLAALGDLARAWVDRLWAEGCKVIAITGSTGKTSTKDILTAMLSPHFEGSVRSSPRNFNTEIGLPLAVLGTEAGTRVLVLEMAMRGPGQITQLCRIAPPEIGVITNIGPVHLELLGTIEAVAEAKAELIAALPPDGTCVVPALAEALHPHLRREVRTLTFASRPQGGGGSLDEVGRVAGAAADVRVLEAEAVERGSGHRGLRAEIAVGANKTIFEFNFRQTHNLVNALAAIAAGHAAGVPIESLAQGAPNVTFSELRGEELELPDSVVVLNDCYNANPISMRAALDHLAETAAEREAPRTVAVLGEMAELGPAGQDFHREIGAYAAERGVHVLVAVGGLGDGYVEGYAAAGEAHRAAGASEAAALLRDLIEPGDVVLVKGSRSVGLETVAESLGQRDPEDAR
jgi:UDP-N-acetylmuramoyl-tripeptide--D-alanyl-D-alanine ligase